MTVTAIPSIKLRLFKRNLDQYKALLNNYHVCYVGVQCDLETLKAREKSRGDRVLGLARGMFDKVHNNEYDIIVDNAKMSPYDSARVILEFLSYPRTRKEEL